MCEHIGYKFVVGYATLIELYRCYLVARCLKLNDLLCAGIRHFF